MPSGGAAKRVMLLAGVVMAALLIAGFVVGAIGSQMFGVNRFLDQPAIHLPPQPVFPFSAVKSSLGYSDYPKEAEAKPADAEHPPSGESADHGEGAEEEHHFTPLAVTQFAITNTCFPRGWPASLLSCFSCWERARRRWFPGVSSRWWRVFSRAS